MAIYIYIKKKNSFKKKIINYISYFFLVIGSFFLFWSFYPIISFEIYSKFFLNQKVISPLKSNENDFLSEANSILGSFNIFSNNLRDFTQTNIWFPSIGNLNFKNNLSIKEYFLSIPKLNIMDAKVIVGSDDLSKSLVHYIPETLPGEYGNVVILGHSTLPQLYNVKDYKTIFTFLPSIEKGDLIKIKINDIEYEYIVYDMFVVNPQDVWVLNQQKDNSYLTLITCVPPGTYLKRLVVKAKLKLI
ncbi:MAG: class D sortase [Patescibacteria group bacterium]|nr:class D sortase [Patescibacteria group bacterium]